MQIVTSPFELGTVVACYPASMIGPRLRVARLARHLSLNTVAGQASISVATLSRIERDQQRIDVELLLSIMRILDIDVHEVFDEAAPADGVNPLAAKITALPSAERTNLWRTLAAAKKTSRGSVANRQVGQQVEEFLAQMDYLRGEIDAIRRKLR